MSITVQEVRRAWHKAEKRRNDTRRKRCMLQNDWRDWLKERILEQFLPENAERLMIRSNSDVNLFAWVTEEIAQIYSKPVERKYAGIEFAPGVEFDLALDQACKWTYALGEVAIRPRWVGERILLDVIPADRFEYGVSSDDPLVVEWICIDITEEGEGKRFRIWTPENYATVDPSWNVTDGGPFPNPYGVVPYIVAHRQYPHVGCWQHTYSDRLVEAALFTGVALTDHHHLRHHQSFKQIVIRGDADAQKQARIASDPTSVITVKGQGAGADVLDMQADLVGNLESLLKRIETTLQQYGIRPEILRGSIDASSGYALKIKLGAQERQWTALRRVWDLWEKILWIVAQVTVPTDGGPSGLPDLESIEWPDLGPGADPKEEADRLSGLVASGIYSPQEALREMGKTDEEIKQIMMEMVDNSAMSAGTMVGADRFNMPRDESTKDPGTMKSMEDPAEMEGMVG